MIQKETATVNLRLSDNMYRRHSWSGMTLVELLATVGIIGLLLVASIPSFRALQARESMTLTQQGIQALLYRMQQLSLAPPSQTVDSPIGYGLAFHKKGSPTTVGPCNVNASNDFIVIYKYAVSQDQGTAGTVFPIINSLPGGQPCGPTGTIDAKDYRQDFYVLPKNIEINAQESTPANLPWLLPVPLRATGTSFGSFDPPISFGYSNPLPENDSSAKAMLVIQHTSIQVGGSKLCRGINFSRSSSGVSATTRQIAGCR